MKKVFTLLVAVTMVIGLAGIAAADCLNCNGTAGNIARGCEGSQQSCSPWDFENAYDYCEDKDKDNRAVFKICDCITDGDFQTVITGDTVDVTFEILVNGETGDNGVYWAEEVGSDYSTIDLELFADQDDACDDVRGKNRAFEGYYEYLLANGDNGWPNTSEDDCTMDDSERVVKIQPDKEANGLYGSHGYVIEPEDELIGNASWVIDIPYLRADTSRVNAGDQVWVRICLQLDCSGICSEAIQCCCDVYIGELCCSFDSADEAGLIYPYFPKASTTVWNLLGMTVTNLGAIDGTATLTIYEADGDMGTLEIEVMGNSIYLNTLGAIVADPDMVATGTLGDAISYITVQANFPATGFAMIADTVDGASMGYLPLQSWQALSLSSLSGLLNPSKP
jgi:hypothetical protein